MYPPAREDTVHKLLEVFASVIRNSSLTLNKAVYFNENFPICLFACQRFSPTVEEDLKHHEGDLATPVLANNGGSLADHYYIEV